MFRTPTLERTVTIIWDDKKSERQCDVRVSYEYDGHKHFEVLSQEILGDEGFMEVPHGLTEGVFNQMVDDATFIYANDDYHDWLSGQDDAREY